MLQVGLSLLLLLLLLRLLLLPRRGSEAGLIGEARTILGATPKSLSERAFHPKSKHRALHPSAFA